MQESSVYDMEEATYTGLRIFKHMGIRIICKGEDITDKIEDLEDVD